MADFDPEQALARYSELSRQEDMLFVQIQHRAPREYIPWTDEQIHIKEQELELEQEAMRNGYILSVACDSAWRAEDTCAIRPMTHEEAQEFLTTDQYPRGRIEVRSTH